MLLGLLVLGVASAASAASPDAGRVWEFDGQGLDDWKPTRDVQPLAARDGALHVSTTAGDPGIILPKALAPGATDWVEIRLRASTTGNAQLIWFPEGTDSFGMATFHVPLAGEWLDLAVFPSWGKGGPLRALRLDVYHFRDGCAFEIDRIAIRPWPKAPASHTAHPWVFMGPKATARWLDWRPARDADVFMSPPLDASKPLGGWAAIGVRATRDVVPALVWAGADGRPGRQAFPLRGDGVSRVVHVQLAGDPAWSGRCSAVGLEIPRVAQDAVQVESLAFVETPTGPPELAAHSFWFENGHNRAGRPCRVLAVVGNIGASASARATLRLELPGGLSVDGRASLTAPVPPLAPGERARVAWEVLAARPGSYRVILREGARVLTSADLTFAAPRRVTPAAYVPPPRPVKTETEVFMFYFPGWNSPGKWAPIRSAAPARKPLLGWYDEANPECVDWQIKWARENGISGFILDWYWGQGERHLEHWLDAYRKARYRDQLKIFLLYCDHGGRDVQAPEEIRPIARHWIDHVFALPGYHKIDGKPVVAVFDPDVLRKRLGGSAGVRAALDVCQVMAREAGYPGIAFLSANNNYPPESAAVLAAEGYAGATTYHEPGYDYHDCPSQQMRSYEKQVRTAPLKWQASLRAHPAMRYFPVVDSGWDSRPWHAYAGAIVHGRTVARFEEWLRLAKAFCRENRIPMVVLGPANEWGEGSYLEPCAEFGFGMYEAVRRVFATGSPRTWPENLSPEDVGRGPYDLDMAAARRRWTFDDGLQGWAAGSGCTAEARDGALRIRSVNDDPTLTCATDFRAEDAGQLVIRLRCGGGTEKANYAQMFWATEGGAISGASVVGFLFEDSEQTREYRVDLSRHPRWRGRIVQLRFDPCCESGMTLAVDEVRFEPAGGRP